MQRLVELKQDDELKKQKVIIFIGLEGAGKSTLASQISEVMGARFYEGDNALLEGTWIKKAAKSGYPVLPKQADEFIRARLLPAVIEQAKLAQKEGKVLIVAQSIFSNVHRKLFHEKFDCEFVHIDLSHEVQKQNLSNRENAFIWKLFSYLNRRFFEIPLSTFTSYTIMNKGKNCEVENKKELEKLPFYKAALVKAEKVRSDKKAALEKPKLVETSVVVTMKPVAPLSQLFPAAAVVKPSEAVVSEGRVILTQPHF